MEGGADGSASLTALTSGAGWAAVVVDCEFFLYPRFGTSEPALLLFSDDVCEVPFPLLALRVLRLRAMAGASGAAPTTGVAVFDVRPDRAIDAGAGGASTSIGSGSCASCSSCLSGEVSVGIGVSAASFGVGASLVGAWSRTMPAACSSSVIALLVGAC